MPNINIPGVKEHMDRYGVSYTVNSDNVFTVTGNLSSEAFDNLVRAARAVGYKPTLASGALKFVFK